MNVDAKPEYRQLNALEKAEKGINPKQIHRFIWIDCVAACDKPKRLQYVESVHRTDSGEKCNVKCVEASLNAGKEWSQLHRHVYGSVVCSWRELKNAKTCN